MATYNRTSLRAAESRVKSGDIIIDSVLIAPEANTPCFVGAGGLEFVRCKFVRCTPPADSRQIDCRSNQTPIPAEPAPEEMFVVGRGELAEIVEAARDGTKPDVTAFCRRHGLTLRTPPRGIPEERS